MLLFAACNREITHPYRSVDEAISFDTYAGGVTRTAALSTGSLTDFGAAAYTGAVQVMDNQLVSGGNGSWTYSPIKYWPQSGPLYFSAYAPYATASNGITPAYNTTTRTIDLSYALPADEANQVDLLMAANVNVADCSADRPAAVQFTFGHILSRIGLSARYTGSVSSGTTVTLTDVKVSGNFVESGDYTVSGGWSNRVAASSAIVYDRPAAKLAATAMTTSAQNLLTGDNYVMVIPNGDEASVTGTITVYYTVTTSDGVSVDYVKDASSQLAYEPNKTYTYNLIIDVDSDAITFGDVTVNDWGTEVSQDVEVRSYSGNIQVVGLSFSPARRNAQFYVRSSAEYEDGEITNIPWHAEFSTDGGSTYNASVPDFFDSIENNGGGTNMYLATSTAEVGEYVDVKFVQDVANGASFTTRAEVLPIIETRDSLIRGYHLRNTVMTKTGDDWNIMKVTDPIEYLDWAQNNTEGRYFSIYDLLDTFNTFNGNVFGIPRYSSSSTLDYSSHDAIQYNYEPMDVLSPAEWNNLRSQPIEKGTFINGIPTRSHFAVIQVDLSETTYAGLENGQNQYNKGYLNGLLFFPDDATVNVEDFTLNCDNNNNTPINSALNFTVYDCLANKLSLSELTALMNGGCVFLPFICYEGVGGTIVKFPDYYELSISKNAFFISNNGSFANIDNTLYIRALTSGYEEYEIRVDPISHISVNKTLVYMIPQSDRD